MSAHAKYSPSAASRWIGCPGSWQLEQEMPDTTSEFAQEGTAAHRLAEWCLLHANQSSVHSSFVEYGTGIFDEEYSSLMRYVTDETFDAVQVYLDYIESFRLSFRGIGEEWIEHKVKTPWPDCWGTVDYLAYVEDPNGFEPNTLHVVDYKHGKGVKVHAHKNPQLAIYAIGAALEYPEAERFVCTTVQPRCEQGDPIESWELTKHELNNWAMLVDLAIKATQAEVRHYETGDHCRFCKAKAVCPAMKADALAAYDHVEPTTENEGATIELLTSRLNGDQTADVLSKAKTIKLFLEAVSEHAERLLQKGVDVPGYKLVEKKANRRWKDPEDVMRRLRNKRVKKADYLDEKLKSPAQLEKVKTLKKWVRDYVEVPKTGPTVAPDSDKREAIQPALKAFDEVEGE